MYLQIMEYRTVRREEMAELEERWQEATEGDRTARRIVVARDRADADRYMVLAFFDDAESADAQYNLAATATAADYQSALLVHPPTFTDLEVIKDTEY